MICGRSWPSCSVSVAFEGEGGLDDDVDSFFFLLAGVDGGSSLIGVCGSGIAKRGVSSPMAEDPLDEELIRVSMSRVSDEGRDFCLGLVAERKG